MVLYNTLILSALCGSKMKLFQTLIPYVTTFTFPYFNRLKTYFDNLFPGEYFILSMAIATKHSSLWAQRERITKICKAIVLTNRTSIRKS